MGRMIDGADGGRRRASERERRRENVRRRLDAPSTREVPRSSSSPRVAPVTSVCDVPNVPDGRVENGRDVRAMARANSRACSSSSRVVDGGVVERGRVDDDATDVV